MSQNPINESHGSGETISDRNLTELSSQLCRLMTEIHDRVAKFNLDPIADYQSFLADCGSLSSRLYSLSTVASQTSAPINNSPVEMFGSGPSIGQDHNGPTQYFPDAPTHPDPSMPTQPVGPQQPMASPTVTFPLAADMANILQGLATRPLKSMTASTGADHVQMEFHFRR